MQGAKPLADSKCAGVQPQCSVAESEAGRGMHASPRTGGSEEHHAADLDGGGKQPRKKDPALLALASANLTNSAPGNGLVHAGAGEAGELAAQEKGRDNKHNNGSHQTSALASRADVRDHGGGASSGAHADAGAASLISHDYLAQQNAAAAMAASQTVMGLLSPMIHGAMLVGMAAALNGGAVGAGTASGGASGGGVAGGLGDGGHGLGAGMSGLFPGAVTPTIANIMGMGHLFDPGTAFMLSAAGLAGGMPGAAAAAAAVGGGHFHGAAGLYPAPPPSLDATNLSLMLNPALGYPIPMTHGAYSMMSPPTTTVFGVTAYGIPTTVSLPLPPTRIFSDHPYLSRNTPSSTLACASPRPGAVASGKASRAGGSARASLAARSADAPPPPLTIPSHADKGKNSSASNGKSTSNNIRASGRSVVTPKNATSSTLRSTPESATTRVNRASRPLTPTAENARDEDENKEDDDGDGDGDGDGDEQDEKMVESDGDGGAVGAASRAAVAAKSGAVRGLRYSAGRRPAAQMFPGGQQVRAASPHAKIVTCSVCKKEFKASHALKVHMRVHSGERPFPCHECGKSFSCAGNLKTHQRLHLAQRPFKCTECGRAFAQKGTLVKHERMHRGEKPFSCQFCSKAFTQSSGLRAHMRTHTGERPYRCEVCGREFTAGSNLTAHRQIHQDVRPFVCPCGRSFTLRSSLKKHERVHTGERPFCCKFCGKAFAQSSQCCRHQRLHVQGVLAGNQEDQEDQDGTAASSSRGKAGGGWRAISGAVGGGGGPDHGEGGKSRHEAAGDDAAAGDFDGYGEGGDQDNETEEDVGVDEMEEEEEEEGEEEGEDMEEGNEGGKEGEEGGEEEEEEEKDGEEGEGEGMEAEGAVGGVWDAEETEEDVVVVVEKWRKKSRHGAKEFGNGGGARGSRRSPGGGSEMDIEEVNRAVAAMVQQQSTAPDLDSNHDNVRTHPQQRRRRRGGSASNGGEASFGLQAAPIPTARSGGLLSGRGAGGPAGVQSPTAVLAATTGPKHDPAPAEVSLVSSVFPAFYTQDSAPMASNSGANYPYSPVTIPPVAAAPAAPAPKPRGPPAPIPLAPSPLHFALPQWRAEPIPAGGEIRFTAVMGSTHSRGSRSSSRRKARDSVPKSAAAGKMKKSEAVATPTNVATLVGLPAGSALGVVPMGTRSQTGTRSRVALVPDIDNGSERLVQPLEFDAWTAPRTASPSAGPSVVDGNGGAGLVQSSTMVSSAAPLVSTAAASIQLPAPGVTISDSSASPRLVSTPLSSPSSRLHSSASSASGAVGGQHSSSMHASYDSAVGASSLLHLAQSHSRHHFNTQPSSLSLSTSSSFPQEPLSSAGAASKLSSLPHPPPSSSTTITSVMPMSPLSLPSPFVTAAYNDQAFPAASSKCRRTGSDPACSSSWSSTTSSSSFSSLFSSSSFSSSFSSSGHPLNHGTLPPGASSLPPSITPPLFTPLLPPSHVSSASVHVSPLAGGSGADASVDHAAPASTPTPSPSPSVRGPPALPLPPMESDK